MLPISHGTLARIMDSVHLALMINLSIVVCCLPIVVVLLTVDPVRSVGALVVVLPLVAPAFTASAVVFAEFSRADVSRADVSRADVSRADSSGTVSSGTVSSRAGDASVVRRFARAWRTHLRRSLGVGAIATAALVVLAVDVRALAGTPVGAVTVPVIAVLALLVVTTSVLALVAVAERPDVPVLRLLRASLFLGVRRWYLTSASLLVLALLAAITVSRPAIGLGLASAPLLYVVWANSRYCLRPILPTASGPASTPVPVSDSGAVIR